MDKVIIKVEEIFGCIVGMIKMMVVIELVEGVLNLWEIV